MPQLQFHGVGEKDTLGVTRFATSAQVNGKRTAGDDGESVIQAEIDKRGWRQYMNDKSFQFTPPLRLWAKQIAKKIRGTDPDDQFQDLYMSMAMLPSGGLWKYNPESGKPLEGFWNYIIKNRAMSYLRDEAGAATRLPTTPLMQDKEEGDRGPGVSEQTIRGQAPSPSSRMETSELLGEFREWLAGERLGPALVKIWDVMLHHATEDPMHPLKQKDLAELTGMSPGQINHYMGEIVQSAKDYAEGDPSMAPIVKGLEKLRSKSGPRSGIYSPPGGSPVEITVVRMGERTLNVKRTDGQPWEGGVPNKNVPKEQVQLR